ADQLLNLVRAELLWVHGVQRQASGSFIHARSICVGLQQGASGIIICRTLGRERILLRGNIGRESRRILRLITLPLLATTIFLAVLAILLRRFFVFSFPAGSLIRLLLLLFHFPGKFFTRGFGANVAAVH